MRSLCLVLTISILVLGVNVLARGEDTEEDPAVAELQEKVARLELQVSYLLSRDADETVYLLANAERGAALEALVQRMRTQGYANKSIPAPSRESLLAGLQALGRDLRQDLPKVTQAQAALLKRAGKPRTD